MSLIDSCYVPRKKRRKVCKMKPITLCCDKLIAREGAVRWGGWNNKATARASLQRASDNHLTTPLRLFEFASTNIPSLKCCFSTTKDYHEIAALLANRMTTAKTIARTQTVHFFKPLLLKLTKSLAGSHILNSCYQTRRVCDSSHSTK